MIQKKWYLLTFSVSIFLLAGFIYTTNFFYNQIIDFFFAMKYYRIIVLLSLLSGFIFIFFRNSSFIRKTNLYIRKYLSYIIFAPLVFLPIFRCYFKIPYIFCHSCPKQCPFGQVRKIAVPLVLAMNIDKRFWCYKYCPIGGLQDCFCMIGKKKITLPKIFSYTGYIFLVVIGILYFLMMNSVGQGRPFFKYYFNHSLAINSLVLAIAALLLLSSIFIPRIFCNHVCPIGTISEAVLKVKRKIKK